MSIITVKEMELAVAYLTHISIYCSVKDPLM
jgi:hypothetical protein